MMHTTDPGELEQTKKFVYNYRIQNIEFKNRQEYERVDYNFNASYVSDYIQNRIVGVVTMEIPEKEFLNVVRKVTEYDEFMHCPDVREAIHQAMFMGRLKGYR